MRYHRTVKGIFQDRPNRFIAHVWIADKLETVHVKNTGRCRELLYSGAEVVLEYCDNPARKTQYDLISVYKNGLGWVNIDSQAPNKVVGEWLRGSSDFVKERFQEITFIKPEYTFGASRIDFYLEYQNHKKNCTQKVLMEVKGVTLEIEGTGYFPDAPTERGIKHLKELTKAAQDGYECYIAFVIQMEQIAVVLPNDSMHKAFGEAFREAVAAGVHVLYLGCGVTKDTLQIEREALSW